ncbi:mucus binding protein [Streptococcus dysgalactiae subsp. equisimilis]|uniref:Ig-like domain-containing protein n=1 Tax=Streptococcus dysgalactiae TaxID=1334 RepID=UPI000D759B9C|nr:Ig-like domain-containing protein [Streptococcus dysgalactiae]PXX82968.1 mucus binding protein [Streptococcus dysgalactiae subsp. equisimilis]
MGTKNRKLKIEGETIVFKRERSRYSIRKNKCYGACSVFLGLTILTLAMAGGNVKAEEVGASNTPTSVEQPAAEVTENTSLVNTDNSSTETDQPASNSEEVTTLQPRAVAPANLVVENMEPKDVSDKIQVLDGKFLNVDQPIDPNQGENFDFETHFYVKDGVKSGDIFTIKLSDNISSFGDDSATIKNVEPLVDTTGDIIATGVANAKEKNITYTFTDAVSKKANVIGHIKFPLFIDRSKILENTTIPITVTVAGSSFTENISVNYTKAEELLSVITSVNKSGDIGQNVFETTYYVNNNKVNLSNPYIELFPINLQTKGPSSTDFSDLKNISIKLFRVPKNVELPSSFGVDTTQLEEVQNIDPRVIGDKIRIDLPKVSRDRYVMSVISPYKGNGENIEITGILYGGEQPSAVISSHILKEGTADASTEVPKGYFVEKHIFQTEKLDGTLIDDFEEIMNWQVGTSNDSFNTKKLDNYPLYQLYNVSSSTGTLFNIDGLETQGWFIPKTTQEVTYYYKKKEPQPLGTIIVRHVEFGTGKELVDSTYADYGSVKSENGNVPVGTTYTTTPKTPLGYELVERPLTESGEVKEGITRLEYLYKARQPLGTVIVRHVEFGTGKELAPSEYATYDDVPAGVPAGSTVAGTGYETKPAQIDGYDLVEVPEDDYGNVFEGITRLTYVYKKQIITGQGEIIDFELESNGDESGQNEQPDEISEHGPLVELEYPSQEGMSGENAGTVEIEENAPIVELDYPSQEGMSGENAGTVEIEESSPIVELDYPSQEGMSGENAGTVEVEENAPIVELDYPSQEGMSGENTGQQTIEEDTPTVTIEEKPVVKPVSSQPSKEELPATGERSETAVTVLGLALSALGLIFIRKRKQN